jgi:hypothetical protein
MAAGCGAQRTPASRLPETFPGGWTRGAIRELTADSAPAEIRYLVIRHAYEAEYEGPVPMKITLWEMPAAFEAAQKWRHREGTIAFHEGSYLVVIDAPRASKAQRDAVAETLAKLLRSGG